MGNWFSDTWKDLTQPGWKQAEDANKTNQQALNAQSDSEAFKRKQMTDQENFALKLMNDPGNGAGGGAMSQANDWMTNYLTFLKDSPDVTYNLESSKLARATADAKSGMIQNMARRGLNTSGLAAGNMSEIDMSAGRAGAELLGRKQDRRQANLAAGAEATQTLLNRALNMYTGAKTGLMGLNTQIPGMLQDKANMQLSYQQQPGVLQQVAGQYIGSKVNDWLNPVQASGGGESALSKYGKMALSMFGL